MAPPPKVTSAMGAMMDLGFSWETTKPVLKELLRVYDNNWDHIEAENYRVLADAILDSLGFGEGGLMEKKKHCDEDDVEHESFNQKRKPEPDQGVRVERGQIHEPELDRKKLRTRMQEISSPQSVCSSDGQIGQPGKREAPLFIAEKSRQIVSAQPSSTYNRSYVDGKDGNAMTQMLGTTSSVGEFICTNFFRKGDKDKKPVHKVLDRSLCYDDPKNDYKMKVPATVINRPSGYGIKRPSSQCHQELASHYNTSKRIGSSRKIESAQTVGLRRGKENSSNDIGKNAFTNVDRSCQDLSSEIASSDSGEVRLMFHCNPAESCPNFQMPSMDLLCKLVEDRYLKSFRILEPGLSLLSLLKEMCHCVIELSSKSPEEQGNIVRVVPVLESLKKTGLQNMIGGMNPFFPNSQADYMDLKVDPNNRSGTCNNGNDARSSGAVANDSLSLVVFQHPQHPSINLRTLAVFDDNDICRGEENVKISLANKPNAEKYPPSFHYIPRNIVYQNAYVNISLARIGDEDCCSTCSGDCLAASIPCPCARETGGDYAYTSEGLMKREFLDAIISMKRDRQKEHLYLCKDCPIERIKDEMMPEPCKGHLIRKFVKECWSKCGCNRICGNRLVQRGITRNLQVFWTAEGKGWGLRTLEELPRGAYICEYVGEILTNTELYDRQLHVTGKMRHTYPVLLDADWGSEQVLKDEEALCLDATFYGNVARFINHRCADANIVEVPVEVETPDHHYYHLAFFTMRKVEALEELTWDYGIDFDDQTHPVEAFSCRCGSKFCRGRPQTSFTLCARKEKEWPFVLG